MQEFLSKIEGELSSLHRRDMFRVLRPPLGHDFCSNDYLGLASHPAIIEAIKHNVDRQGFGSTSSRFIRGERTEYTQLEHKLAQFKKCESALLFSSGYMANLGVLSSLIGKQDMVFSDQLNHASLIDGIRLTGATLHIYPHLDSDALKAALNNAPKNAQKFLVTESLFSMDGDIAPLDVYAKLAHEHDLVLIVDECHATGLYGQHGSGLIDHFGVTNQVAISINGLGKAFGCYGAFVAGQKILIDFLLQKSRSLMFTTALPPLMLTAIDAALPLVMRGDLQTKLFDNVSYLTHKLAASGLVQPHAHVSPIIPIILGENSRTQHVAHSMLEAGFDIRAIRPPTVSEGQARLRITARAGHSYELMDEFVDRLREFVRL